MNKKKQSKTGFILSLPRDTPATEVIAKAKSRGMKLSKQQVHTARYLAREREKKLARLRGKQLRNAVNKAASTPTTIHVPAGTVQVGKPLRVKDHVTLTGIGQAVDSLEHFVAQLEEIKTGDVEKEIKEKFLALAALIGYEGAQRILDAGYKFGQELLKQARQRSQAIGRARALSKETP